MMIDKERLKDQLQNAAERKVERKKGSVPIPTVKRKKASKILERYPYQKWLSQRESRV